MTASFRQAVPIAGAPTQWEKTKRQEASNGVDSVVTALRRKAKALARRAPPFVSKGGNKKGTRNVSLGSTSGHRAAPSRTQMYSRAGSLPPGAGDCQQKTLGRADIAEEAPFTLEIISETPSIDVVVRWPVETPQTFPLRRIHGSS